MATKINAAKKFPKIGRTVEFTRRNGEFARGRIHGVDDRPNGRWVAVNTAEKRHEPQITNVRESQLNYV